MITLFFWAQTASTVYHISSSGDDRAAGTSPTTAWRSLNRTLTTPLAPGDSILLERGSQWTDEVIRLPFLSLGALGAYGNASLPRPRITVSRSASSNQGSLLATCVELVSPRDVTISELHLQGCSTGLRINAVGASKNVVIESIFFADIRMNYADYSPGLAVWAIALSLEGAGSLTNVTVRNNVGVRMETFFRAESHVNGLTLQGNTVAQCGDNCVFIGDVKDLRMRDSVFLRDNPVNLFLYGTTDVIIGSASGDNEIVANDFYLRGEYEAGPDGCAIDFETSATGFVVANNTIFRSWGAGIMIFGHDTTSHGLEIVGNTFAYDGCVQVRGEHASSTRFASARGSTRRSPLQCDAQPRRAHFLPHRARRLSLVSDSCSRSQPRGDHAGIAVMCPNGHAPSGMIEGNDFMTCPGVEGIYINPVKGCAANLTIANNTNNTVAIVAQPQLSIVPVAPSDPSDAVTMPIVAQSATAGATLRYTVDGSRPSATSALLPSSGVLFDWPGPNFVMNVKGFKAGMAPSVTNGVVVERALYRSRVVDEKPLASSLDGITRTAPGGDFTITGWVVDANLEGGGVPSLNCSVSIDMGARGARFVADAPRPDLVAAKIAPNAAHGVAHVLSAAESEVLAAGKVSFLLCTVIFYANLAHSLTRSP